MLIKYFTPLVALHLLLATFTISIFPFAICSVAWADDGKENAHEEQDSDSQGSDDDESEEHRADSGEDSGPSSTSPAVDYEGRERRTLDAVERAVRKNEILSLRQVKALVHAQYSKQIVRVKIERNWFQWIYKIKAVNKRGRLIEIVINAETGRTIRIENE